MLTVILILFLVAFVGGALLLAAALVWRAYVSRVAADHSLVDVIRFQWRRLFPASSLTLAAIDKRVWSAVYRFLQRQRIDERRCIVPPELTVLVSAREAQIVDAMGAGEYSRRLGERLGRQIRQGWKCPVAMPRVNILGDPSIPTGAVKVETGALLSNRDSMDLGTIFYDTPLLEDSLRSGQAATLSSGGPGAHTTDALSYVDTIPWGPCELYSPDGRYELDLNDLAGQVYIGRDEGSHLRIEHSEVSRRQAVLERRIDGRWTLSDAGSLNGTYLSGHLVEGAVLLGNGDRIRLGRNGPELVFRQPLAVRT